MTRHEFLQALHDMLRPQVYLEVGVQHGTSLRLSRAPVQSIGIDPYPLVKLPMKGGHEVHELTSDEYFRRNREEGTPAIRQRIDLAFIDGMHLVENALRDFANIEALSHDKTVIVFDDVLPTTVEMAAREQCAGDWTGDVWRVYDILRERRPDLVLLLADTQPTGVLAVLRPDPVLGPQFMKAFEYAWDHGKTQRTYDYLEVFPAVLDRRHALDPIVVLSEIEKRVL